MSVFKVFKTPKNTNYTVINNDSLLNRDLSNAAVGLLVKILSLPEEWNFSVRGLVEICGDGERSVRSTLKELEDKGYMEKVQDRDRGLIGESCYIFYESVSLNPHAQNPHVRNAHVESANVQNAHVESEAQLSTHQSITQELITQELSIQDEIDDDEEARTREDAASDLSDCLEQLLGRPLSNMEHDYCNKWTAQDLDPAVILIAVKDNTFRKNFGFNHVQDTLDDWTRRGIRDALSARNFILDRHADRLIEKIDRKSNGNQEWADGEKMDNPVIDLRGSRDYMLEKYRNKEYDSLINMASSTYHDDLFDYLPAEIKDFVEENKYRYGTRWDGPKELLITTETEVQNDDDGAMLY